MTDITVEKNPIYGCFLDSIDSSPGDFNRMVIHESIAILSFAGLVTNASPDNTISNFPIRTENNVQNFLCNFWQGQRRRERDVNLN